MIKKLKIFGTLFSVVLIAFASAINVSAKTETVIDNVFQMDGVDILLKSDKTINSSLLPGQYVSHVQSVVNNGADCYLRAKLECDMPDVIDNVDMCNGWELYADGYYYHKSVAESESQIDIYNGFTVSTDVSNDLQNRDLTLSVNVDAIQSANFSPDWNSKSPWGAVNILACRNAGKYGITAVKSVSPFTITYSENAEKLVTNSSNFFSNFGNVLPGDVYKDSIEFVNNSNHEVVIDFKQNKSDNSLLNNIGLKISIDNKSVFTGTLGSAIEFSILKIPANSSQTIDFEVSVPNDLNSEFAFEDNMVKWYFSAGDFINTATPDSNTDFPAMNFDTPGGFVTTGETVCAGILFIVLVVLMAVIYLTRRGNRHEN